VITLHGAVTLKGTNCCDRENLHLYGTHVPLPCSQELTTGPYSEPKLISFTPTLFTLTRVIVIVSAPTYRDFFGKTFASVSFFSLTLPSC
jgi:hypothetical protein